MTASSQANIRGTVMGKMLGRVTAIAALVWGSLAAPGIAGAAATQGPAATGCRVTSFVPGGGQLSAWTSRPVITIADQITIGAYTTGNVLVEQNPATPVTASARLDPALGAASVWAAVEARAGRPIARQGEHTGPSRTPWTDSITRASTQNRVAVYYRGVTVHTARYHRDLCVTRSGTDIGVVTRAWATVRTFSRAVVQDRLWCGSPARSVWETAAQRYCR